MQQVIYYGLFIAAYCNPYCQTKDSSCGRPKGNSVIEKIIGGYDVGYYKYSWFAVLILNEEIICGAALIGSRTVLTAAHCFKPHFNNIINGNVRIEDIYTIKLGIYNSCKKEDTQRQFRCSKIFIHEQYFEGMPYFDIALIILHEEAKEFTPICLPYSVLQYKEGIVQGFGKIQPDMDIVPCTLQEARLLIYSDAKCKSILEYQDQNSSELQHAFCAGYLDGKIDTCMGDSGGPFVVIDENGRYVQQGITSFGFGCAKKNAPGFYTDVSHFVDWIYKKSGIDENNIFVPEINTTPFAPSKNINQLKFESAHAVSFVINPQKVFWPFRSRQRKKKMPNLLKSNTQVNSTAKFEKQKN